MRRRQKGQAGIMTSYRGPPMTLGNAAAARVRLIVWCFDSKGVGNAGSPRRYARSARRLVRRN
jgi:hypothetical protein